MSDLLDPATLTPESLYRLQSETWAQGAEYERERIFELLEGLAYIDEQGDEMISEYKADLFAAIRRGQKDNETVTVLTEGEQK